MATSVDCSKSLDADPGVALGRFEACVPEQLGDIPDIGASSSNKVATL